jgi:hypothetical protein
MNVQYAAADRGPADSATSVIARTPTHIRAEINRVRATRGLPVVLSTRDYEQLAEARVAAEATAQVAEARRSGVWLDQGGRLLAAGSPAKPARPASRSTAPARVLLPYRVVIVPAYGDAGHGFREHVAPDAFGNAAALNASPSWSLRHGHRGPTLQLAGHRLRAVDSSAGPIIVWEPDPRAPMTPDVVQAFERSINGTMPVSVGMTIKRSRPSRIVRGTMMITEACLGHVAILFDADDRPVYGSALAMFRRSQWADDKADLDAHIAAAIAEARFRNRQAGRSR